MGKSLGRFVYTCDPKATSYEVISKGTYASKSIKLIKESVLVGVLTAKTNSAVNIISAAGIAESNGISATFSTEESKCCGGVVTVKTNTGLVVVGMVQGRRAYVHSYNGATFEPPVSLEGFTTLFEVAEGVTAEIVFQELSKTNSASLVSITRSKSNSHLYVVHSSSKLNLGLTLNVTSVAANEF